MRVRSHLRLPITRKCLWGPTLSHRPLVLSLEYSMEHPSTEQRIQYLIHWLTCAGESLHVGGLEQAKAVVVVKRNTFLHADRKHSRGTANQHPAFD